MKPLKQILALGLSLALSLALVACGGPSSSQSTGAGSAASAGGAAAEGFAGIVKIAVAAPMTGDNAEYGIGFVNAAQLQAELWNAAGGVVVAGESYQVEIVVYDDKNDSDEAQAVAEQIVSDPDIYGVIGHFTSGVCMTTAPTYQESRYINVSPTSSHADYSSIGDYIFRNNTVIDVETRTAAEIAVNDLGGEAIGVLSIDTEWGQSAGDAMERNIESFGGSVALRQQVAADQVDFATEIANFKAAGVDVVLVASMYETLAPFALAAHESDLGAQLIGCSNAYTEGLITIAGEAAEGIYAPVSFFAGDPDPAKAAYVAAYTDACGSAPSALTTHAYDSVGIILEAIARADSFDREAIKNAMYETDYPGMSGHTTFDEIGDAQKVFTKITVVDGEFVLAVF